MLMRWAAMLLWILLLTGTASAVTTVTAAGGPIRILPGETVDIDLLLETDDPGAPCPARASRAARASFALVCPALRKSNQPVAITP